MSKEIKKVITPEFRVSFPSIFNPSKFDDSQEAKYSVIALFPSGANLKPLEDLIQDAARTKWGEKVPKDFRSPLRDGNEKELDSYKDCNFCSMTSKVRPGLIDINRNEIIDQNEFYGGCYAKASIVAYAYGGAGTKFKPGVAFGLRNLMKTRDGEPFTSRSTPEDDFGSADNNANDMFD